MKNDARRFFGFARLLALGMLSALICSGAIAATASVIPIKQQNLILKDPGTAVLGAKAAEVTVVEYFDYNCPYCRTLAPSIRALIESDHKVAVVFKEWPIFGGVSVYAARCALASQWQGKYLAAHDALISAPRLSQETEVDDTLRKAGINLSELKKALAENSAKIDAILTRNDSEARSLGIRGTPGLLVGRDVSNNVDDLAALQTAVAKARHTP
jgi:protein-disulfide isomerase